MFHATKWVVLVAATAMTLAPEESSARPWRRGRNSGFYIGAGPGGTYAGYGSGWYGPGYSYGPGYTTGWYGPVYQPGIGIGVTSGYYNNGYSPNTAYYPGATYYDNSGVVYSPPAYGTQSNGVAVTPQQSTGDVEILNPADNSSALNYALNGQNYTIQPGQTQRVQNDRRWIIEFPRGDNPQEVARYTLSPGRVKFKPMDRGWELVRAADQSSRQSVETAKPPLPDDRTFDDQSQPVQRRGSNQRQRNDEFDQRDNPDRNGTELPPEPK